MLQRIISGGQTGVDQAAWRAAKACGLKTGGLMPKGFLTEDGKRPEFAGFYGAKETDTPEYPPRTIANVGTSHATLVVTPYGYPVGRGTRLTIGICEGRLMPHKIVQMLAGEDEATAQWIRVNDFVSLNVAGPRESSSPGIGEAAELWLTQVFRRVLELQG